MPSDRNTSALHFMAEALATRAKSLAQRAPSSVAVHLRSIELEASNIGVLLGSSPPLIDGARVYPSVGQQLADLARRIERLDIELD